MKHSLASRLISLTILSIATLATSLPYGFYQLLRFMVCGTLAYLAYQAFETKHKVIAWSAVILAITFNPLLPLHLDKDIWRILNVVALLLLVVTLLRRNRKDF